MFDYKLFAALAVVMEQGGFERAAQAPELPQSAVSQRIKLLEARVGQPILVCETPPHPTDLGRRLFSHVRQARLLEDDLQCWVSNLDEGGAPECPCIALNVDNLATWWAVAVGDLCAEWWVLLDLVVEDQKVGLKRMRVGEVAGCVCGSARPVAGARSLLLGAMCYRGLASPDFIARHFPRGAEAAALVDVPAAVFGSDGPLQHRFFKDLGIGGGFIYYLCPSSEGFVRLTAGGLGWDLVPERQVQGEPVRGELVESLPGQAIDVPLYWHCWCNGGELLVLLTEHLSARVGDGLVRVAG